MIRTGSAVLIALTLPIQSCASQDTPTAPPELPPDAVAPELPSGGVAVEFDPVVEVISMVIGGPQEPTRSVLRDEQSWLEFWRALTAVVSPAPEPPTVDFTADMVLVAAMGRRATGGFAVSVEGVYTSDGALYVDVLERSPGVGCLSAQVITTPVTAVRVRVHDGSVQFVTREQSGPCD